MAKIRDVMHILKAGGLDLSEQWDMTPVVTGATAPDQTKDLGGVSTVVSPGELSFAPFTAADTDPGAVIASTALGFLAGSHSQQLATTGVSQISVIIPALDPGDNFSTEGFQLALCFLPITATATDFIAAVGVGGTIGGSAALLFPATGTEGLLALDDGVAAASAPQVLPAFQPGDKVTFGYNNLTTELTLSVNDGAATVLTALDLSASPMIGFIGAVFSQEKAIFANAPLAYSFGMTSAVTLPAGAASGKPYIVSAAGSFNGKKGEVGDIAILTAGATDVFFIRNIPNMADLGGGVFTKEANIYLGYVNTPEDRRYASWETAHAAAQGLVTTGHIVNFYIDYSGEDYTVPPGKWSLAGIRFKEDPFGLRLGAKVIMSSGATFIPWDIGVMPGTSLGMTLADLRHLYISSADSYTSFLTYSMDDLTAGLSYVNTVVIGKSTGAYCNNGTTDNYLIKNELTNAWYNINGVTETDKSLGSSDSFTGGGFYNMDYLNSGGSVDWTVQTLYVSSDFALSLGKQSGSWTTMAYGLGYASSLYVVNFAGANTLGINHVNLINDLKSGAVAGALTQNVTVINKSNAEGIEYNKPGVFESITVKEALDSIFDEIGPYLSPNVVLLDRPATINATAFDIDAAVTGTPGAYITKAQMLSDDYMMIAVGEEIIVVKVDGTTMTKVGPTYTIAGVDNYLGATVLQKYTVDQNAVVLFNTTATPGEMTIRMCEWTPSAGFTLVANIDTPTLTDLGTPSAGAVVGLGIKDGKSLYIVEDSLGVIRSYTNNFGGTAPTHTGSIPVSNGGWLGVKPVALPRDHFAFISDDGHIYVYRVDRNKTENAITDGYSLSVHTYRNGTDKHILLHLGNGVLSIHAATGLGGFIFVHFDGVKLRRLTPEVLSTAGITHVPIGVISPTEVAAYLPGSPNKIEIIDLKHKISGLYIPSE